MWLWMTFEGAEFVFAFGCFLTPFFNLSALNIGKSNLI